MNNLHILSYNNYFDRIVKIGNPTLDDTNNIRFYDNWNIATKTNVDFKPNDGINTSCILNINNIDETTQPDYMIVTDTTESNIISRWYITSFERLSKNQYKALLKRDIIADNYLKVINSTCFIEKATLRDTDPLIYNSENMTFNKIKKSETLLKDYTNMPWIVGYVARNYVGNNTFSSCNYYDMAYANITDYPYYELVDKYLLNKANGINIIIPTQTTFGNICKLSVNCNELSASLINETPNVNNQNVYHINNNSDSERIIENIQNTTPLTFAQLNYGFANCVWKEDSVYTNVLNENHKIIKIGNICYEVNIELNDGSINSSFYGVNTDADLYVKYITNNILVENNTNIACCYGTYNGRALTMTLNRIDINTDGEFNINFTNTRNHCDNSSYDMFCLPYGELNYNGITTSYRNSMTIAAGIGSLTGVVYDLQLLPYCPIRDLNISNTNDILNTFESKDITYIDSGEGINKGFILWVKSSNFSFNIPYEINIENVKIQNETDCWRICSPNYNGIYEFNATKNKIDGTKKAVSYINVDCTYKPFSPYIHLNPNFDGLYGFDFNDSKGLICGGDFSLDIVSDKWQEYQIQNKNYNNQFDREIQAMDVEHKWKRAESIVNIATGTAGAGIIGSMATKGPAGAIIGGAAGLTEGVLNYAEQEALYKNQMSLKKDMFGYQLDNVKALPNSLTKISALNYNNKLFPFIEYYTCTDEEKDALIQKLYYNGMQVGKISKIAKYVNDAISDNKMFIKATLIRLDSALKIDFKQAQEINNELQMGLFM